MNQVSFESVLNDALKLPLEQQQNLVEQLLQSLPKPAPSRQQQEALEIVEKTYGTIKGLEKETLIQLAEDEEYCGY